MFYINVFTYWENCLCCRIMGSVATSATTWPASSVTSRRTRPISTRAFATRAQSASTVRWRAATCAATQSTCTRGLGFGAMNRDATTSVLDSGYLKQILNKRIWSSSLSIVSNKIVDHSKTLAHTLTWTHTHTHTHTHIQTLSQTQMLTHANSLE